MPDEERVDVGRLVRDTEAEARAAREAAADSALDVLAFAADVTVSAGLATTLRTAFGRFSEAKRRALLESRVGHLEGVLEKVKTELEAEGRLARDYLESDLFMERAVSIAARVVREESEEKRRFYALILANSCDAEVDRSWYPTALKILDALEPVHVLILRALLEAKAQTSRGSETLSARFLAIGLHLPELRDALPQLLDEVPVHFAGAMDRPNDWHNALSKAENDDAQSARRLGARVDQWSADILAHIWYLGSEGLVHQRGENQASINQLGEKFLTWVVDPSPPPTGLGSGGQPIDWT